MYNISQLENFENHLDRLCKNIDNAIINGNKPTVYNLLEDIKLHVVLAQPHLKEPLKTRTDSLIRYIIKKIQKEGF